MKKKGIISILSIVLIIFTSVNASAYVLLNYKWSSSSVKYYYDSYNSTRGKTYITSGATAWNSTDATYSNSSSYNVYASEVTSSNVSWDGLCTVVNDGTYFTSAFVYLNAYYTTTWNNDNALKSVAVHEFGHALGLGDNGSTKTIMNAYTWGDNSRYGSYGLTVPQTDDQNGVNALY